MNFEKDLKSWRKDLLTSKANFKVSKLHKCDVSKEEYNTHTAFAKGNYISLVAIILSLFSLLLKIIFAQ